MSAVTTLVLDNASTGSISKQPDAAVFNATAGKAAVAEIDSLPAPEPTPDDQALIAQAANTAATRWPVANGVPYLVVTGNIKLPGKLYLTACLTTALLF